MSKPWVLITGGSRGIGFAIAEQFAQSGEYNVLLLARDANNLKSAREKLESQLPDKTLEVIGLSVDVTNEIQVNALKLSGYDIHVLINNAGAYLHKSFIDTSWKDVEEQMRLNLKGSFLLSKLLENQFLARKRGLIVNICSIASEIGLEHASAYSIGKHALLGFGRAQRSFWMEKGVGVTNLILGSTYSTSWEGTGIDSERLVQATDVGRLLLSLSKFHPSSVAETIHLLPQKGQL